MKEKNENLNNRSQTQKNNLPMDIATWFYINKPKTISKYSEDLEYEISFIQNRINRIFFPSYEDQKKHLPIVISSFCHSKSDVMPIYKITQEQYGIEIVFGYSFYSWKVSVKSEKPIDYNFMNIFDSEKTILALCCPGFPIDKVYDSFKRNHSKFTIEIPNDYNLYTFFFILKNYLKNKND